MIKVLLVSTILLMLFGCAITQQDLDFTWFKLQEYYGVKDKVMPEIMYIDRVEINAEGYIVTGRYFPATNQIHLYKYYDYTTIEHEFRHALGDDIGEERLIQ
jgi:hypothetical protein